jgi:uncharacterized protein YuzE
MKEIRFTGYFMERLKFRKISENVPIEILKYVDHRFYDRETIKGTCEGRKMDKTMKQGTLKYYEESDILYFFLKEGMEKRNIEVVPGVTIELNNKNEIIGIEILDASKFVKNYILKTFSKDLDLVETS